MAESNYEFTALAEMTGSEQNDGSNLPGLDGIHETLTMNSPRPCFLGRFRQNGRWEVGPSFLGIG